MKNFFLILICSVQTVFGQGILGTWSGELDIQGMKLPLVIHITEKDGVLVSTLDSPKQGAKGLPVKETTFANDELAFDAPTMGVKYKGKLNEGVIVGEFFQNGMKLPLNLKRGDWEIQPLIRHQNPSQPYSYFTEDVSFKSEKEGNILAGTIAAPTPNKDIPIYVLITGSGFQNRDSEIFGHKPFLVIADHLAKNGIATLRLDDRGVGGSEKGKPGATTEDFAGDISSAVDFLAEMGYKNIGLIGHSEGGMIAPMVGQINKKVKSMILLAAPGIPITELMKLQTYRVSLSSGMSEEQASHAAEQNYDMYHFVKGYQGSALESDFRKYVKQNNPLLKEREINVAVQQFTDTWFQYFLRFDPSVYLSKTKVPVLAINGSLDVQVTSKENLEGIKKALKKAKNKKSQIVEIEGLNHLFQTAKTGGVAEYAEIEETFAPQVLDKMTEWIKSQGSFKNRR
jgi:pimeloyl-ACP methyl ester carboxylesterase